MRKTEKIKLENRKKELFERKIKQEKELSEKQIESKFRDRVENLGGLCIKMIPAIQSGLPDRLVILPGAIVEFVELKKVKDGKPTELRPVQRNVRTKLNAMGVKVWVVYDAETMDEFFIDVVNRMP